MVFEMSGYFFGTLANSMLILCINTAKYKVGMVNRWVLGGPDVPLRLKLALKHLEHSPKNKFFWCAPADLEPVVSRISLPKGLP